MNNHERISHTSEQTNIKIQMLCSIDSKMNGGQTPNQTFDRMDTQTTMSWVNVGATFC